jgi:hypothetical protein
MRLIVALLLSISLLGCSTNKEKSDKHIDRLKQNAIKRVNSLSTISSENRDSVLVYIDKLEEILKESSRIEFTNFLDIMEAEKKYGTSIEDLQKVVDKGVAKFRRKLDEMIVARMAMKRFCTEEEWKIINPKDNKKKEVRNVN